MNRIVAILMGAALTGAPLAAHATIRVFRYSGTVCQAASLADGNVSYGQFGVQNNDPTTRRVICPLPTNNAGAANEVMTNMLAVTIYDRSTNSDVVCSLQATDSAGNIIFNQTLSSPSPGGPGSGLQQLLFNPSGHSIQDFWLLNCTLPAVQSGAFSHIAAITLTSQF